MARNTTEIPIEQLLVSEIKKAGGRCLKVEVANDPGYPDRWCLLPNGCMFMVECKYGAKGVISVAQKTKITALRSLGFRVYIARSSADIRDILTTESVG